MVKDFARLFVNNPAVHMVGAQNQIFAGVILVSAATLAKTLDVQVEIGVQLVPNHVHAKMEAVVSLTQGNVSALQAGKDFIAKISAEKALMV